MECLLPKDKKKRDEIFKLAKEGLALAELEYLGVAPKIISTIEENCGALYLSQLLKMRDDQILGMNSMGISAISQLKKAFEKILDMPQCVEKWHKGSDSLEKYKKSINKRKFLA